MIRMQNICTVFQTEVYQTVTKSSTKLMIGNLKKLKPNGQQRSIKLMIGNLGKLGKLQRDGQQSTPLYVAKRTR